MVALDKLEKDLQQGNLKSLYLLYGEEHYLIDTCLKKIRKLFGECIKGINYIAIDETNYKEMIQDIETPAFGYPKKLIVARNTGIFKKEGKRKNSDISEFREKLYKYLEENWKTLSADLVLVFIEEDVDKQNLYKWIDSSGEVCQINFQKAIQLEARLVNICNMYQVKIDKQTIQYFLECCGTNMEDLINEIRKLIEYVGTGGTIKKEMIDLLSIKKLESVIFDLTDSLGRRNLKQALVVYRNLIYQKEPVQKILITLYNHFKKLYLTLVAVNLKKDVATSLNLKPNQVFLVNKYKMQAKYFTEKELKGILSELNNLDYKSKQGLIDIQIGLETVLCEYCS